MKPGLEEITTLKSGSFDHPMEGKMIYIRSEKQKAFLRVILRDLKEHCTEWKIYKWGEGNSTISFKTIPFGHEDGKDLLFEGNITYQTPAWTRKCMRDKNTEKYPCGCLLLSI